MPPIPEFLQAIKNCQEELSKARTEAGKVESDPQVVEQHFANIIDILEPFVPPRSVQ